MVPTPIGIFLVCGEITKIISKMFQKRGKFHVILEKTSKNVLKQNSQVGGFNLHKLHSFTNRMVPTPHRYLSCVWRNYQNNFKNVSETRKISCYFWNKRQKNILKQNSQVGGFYFPGTAFNYKSNGTNPPSVSFLCVEKLAK